MSVKINVPLFSHTYLNEEGKGGFEEKVVKWKRFKED